MCDDYIHSAVVAGGPAGVTACVRQRLLRSIDSSLRDFGKSLRDAEFASLPQIDESIEADEEEVEQYVIDGDELAERVRIPVESVCADGAIERRAASRVRCDHQRGA